MNSFIQHPTSYDYDEGEWHIQQVRTTSAAQSDFDNPFVLTDKRILEIASILKIETVLRRNFVFYNHLISAPLIGIMSTKAQIHMKRNSIELETIVREITRGDVNPTVST